MDEDRLHVQLVPDDVPRSVHVGDGDLHDVSGEKCSHDGTCGHDEMNGDEIYEACQGPDSEVECDVTCQLGKVTFVGKECVALMSLKVEVVVQVQNVVHGLGQENVLVGDDGGRNRGLLDVHDVLGDVQGLVHVYEKVWRSCVRYPGKNGRGEIVLWSVK